MASRLSGRKFWLLKSLVAGSLLINSQSASASSDFRDFREDNPGVDRHQLRQMFREQNRADRPANFSRIEQRIEQRLTNEIQRNAGQQIDTGRNNFDRRIINQIDRGRTIEIGSNNRLLKLGAGLNLDLTSAERNIVLGNKLLGGESVQITVGGETKSLAGGERVTAAEYLAVKQALGSGQTLSVSADGSASGGTLSLDGLTSEGSMRAASLVVAEGVTAAGNFSKGSAFRLTGDLTNYGTLLVVSDRRGGSLQGDDVLNAAGARISATGDLHIGAARTFTNDGTVTASSALTITAGEAIKNTSSISAQQDLTIYAANIENSGTITSNNSNVNVYGPSTSALTFNNAYGSVNALNGAINFRDAAYNGSFNTAITGGDLFSKAVNMATGQGTMDLDVNKLTGTLSQSGYAAHVSADTDNLNLGNICLTGDPTYKNAGGDISISGDLTAQEALVIIARDDVLITSSGISIVAGNSTTGFPITIIAGANITSGGTDSPTLPAGATPAAVTITGNGTGSTTGGSVIVSGVGSTISSRSTGRKGSAGNVFIGAMKGTDLNSGSINLSGLSILAGGRKSKDVNGTVTVTGGGAADGSVLIGSIDTTGGTTNSGAITIRTAGVNSSNNSPITWDSTGAITSGNVLVSGALAKATAADVTINGTVISNANISIESADDVLLGNSALVRSRSGDVSVDGNARIFSFAGLFQADKGTIRLAAGDVGNNSLKVNVLSAFLKVTADVGSTSITSKGAVVMNDPSSAVNILAVQATKGITVNGAINAAEISMSSSDEDVVVNGSMTTATGPIGLTSTDENVIVNGTLTASTIANLTSLNGDIKFGEGSSVVSGDSINAQTTAGKILFDTNSSLQANGGATGSINISRGPAGGQITSDPKYTTVVRNGGKIEFRGQSVRAKQPNNTVEATSGKVVFSSDKKSRITLGGGVTILKQ